MGAIDPETDFVAFHRRQQAALDGLLAMPQRAQLEIWRDLPAPPLAELDGEYSGLKTLVEADEATRRWAYELMWHPTGERGFWLGKAFRPTSPVSGEGYNCWARVGGRVHRFLRFATGEGVSVVDGRPAYLMRYAAFRNPSGETDLVDELRRYVHGIYIGVATRRAPDGSRTPPSVFLIAGPGAPWRGVDDDRLER